VALTKVTSAVIKDATITDADIGSTLTTAISGSTTAVSSSIATRFDSRETDMTLATASIAAITASISQIDSEIDTNSANMTLATASIAAITASISRIDSEIDTNLANMTLATASIAAITASLGQPVNTDSNVTFNTISSGDITSTGTITAVEVHTTFISSSITVASGSNNFGDALDDHHSFTGSLSISGSGTVTGSLTVEGPSTFSTADINGGTIDGITSLTAGGDLDIGAHDLRAATITADSLTATRVPFAGTAGVLSDDADLTFATATLSATNLTTTGTIKNMALVSGSSVSTGSFGSVVAGGTGVNSFTGNVILDNPGSLTRMTLENDTESNLLFTLGGSNKGQLYIDSNGVSLRSESGEDLRLLTGGNNVRMFFSGSGNVGIGTTAPAELLNLYSQAGSGDTTIRLDHGASGRGNIYLRSKNSGNQNWFVIGEETGGDFLTVMADNDGVGAGAGNIGIGTITPSAKLEINQDNNANALSIDAESTTENVMTFVAPTTTTATVLAAVNANSLTTGRVAYFHSDSSTTNVRKLVEIHNDNTSAVGATALKIQQDAAQIALHIETTTKSGLYVHNNVDASAEPLVKIHAQGDDFDQNVLQVVNAGDAHGIEISGNGSLHVSTDSAPAKIRLTRAEADEALVDNDVVGEIEFFSNDGSVASNAQTKVGRIFTEIQSTALQTNMQFHTFNTDLAERMRIIADGKVGMGISAPTALLHVTGGTINNTVGDQAATFLKGFSEWGFQELGTTGDNGLCIYGVQGGTARLKYVIGRGHTGSNDFHKFYTAETVRLTIEADGSIQIPGTLSIQGITEVKSLRARDNNAYDIGTSSKRFREIFATNGTINTSDARLKESIEDSALGLDFLNKHRPVSFNWKDIKENGTLDKKQKHYGFIAQEVEQVLVDSNISTQDFAPLIKSNLKDDNEVETGENIYGIRYAEYIGILVKAVQELSEQNKVLEKRIEELKN